MIQTRQIGNITEISVDNGYLHKIGTDTYVKRCILLPSLSIEDYEEVDEMPPYTKEEYDNKVVEFIRERYSDSEEFAIQRKMINSINGEEDNKAIEEYNTYNQYVEECKERAKIADYYKREE